MCLHGYSCFGLSDMNEPSHEVLVVGSRVCCHNWLAVHGPCVVYLGVPHSHLKQLYSFGVFPSMKALLTPVMGDLYCYDSFWKVVQKCFTLTESAQRDNFLTRKSKVS